MKRLLILTTLAIVAVSAMATTAFAGGAFGLFYNPLYCDKRCGAFAIHKNAFTQVPNCCPGPCYAPGCNPTGPGALGPCGFNGAQSFGCGGFHVRRLFSKHWTRCQDGGCSVGGDYGGGEFVGGGHEGAPIYDGNGHHNGPLGAATPTQDAAATPVASRPTVPYWTANLNNQQVPANYAQPVSYQAYGMNPAMTNWAGYGYGYGYYPMPMYNPALWQWQNQGSLAGY